MKLSHLAGTFSALFLAAACCHAPPVVPTPPAPPVPPAPPAPPAPIWKGAFAAGEYQIIQGDTPVQVGRMKVVCGDTECVRLYVVVAGELTSMYRPSHRTTYIAEAGGAARSVVDWFAAATSLTLPPNANYWAGCTEPMTPEAVLSGASGSICTHEATPATGAPHQDHFLASDVMQEDEDPMNAQTLIWATRLVRPSGGASGAELMIQESKVLPYGVLERSLQRTEGPGPMRQGPWEPRSGAQRAALDFVDYGSAFGVPLRMARSDLTVYRSCGATPCAAWTNAIVP